MNNIHNFGPLPNGKTIKGADFPTATYKWGFAATAYNQRAVLTTWFRTRKDLRTWARFAGFTDGYVARYEKLAVQR
jgi:hypothetical protein